MDVVHPPSPMRPGREHFDAELRRDPWGSGVWRYKSLVHPALLPRSIVSRAEGNTPMYESAALARFAGLDALSLKHEGHNPTGSFKDRGMTVAVSQAVASGARYLACASTGNTSASLASYAAAAGVPAAILVPAGKVSSGKLAQALAYGARTLLLEGDFDVAMRLVQRASEDLGLWLLNSLNPWRLEGQKTVVLELLQQRGWRAPDWIAVPAGNLGNTAAFGRALVEAWGLGLIDTIPRILAVQAAGAAPFAASFVDEEGTAPPGGLPFREVEPVAAETVASAIRIGDPVSVNRAVRSIVATSGAVLSVRDDELLEAKVAIDAAGIGAEPASCASLAGVRVAVRQRLVRPDEDVVCVLTGHLLKDPEVVVQVHEGELSARRARLNPPRPVAPSLAAIRRALED